MSKAKPKWYDDWSLEYQSPDSYGMCDIKISIPHSATEEKVFRVRYSPDSQVRQLAMLLDCALTELTERDKFNAFPPSAKEIDGLSSISYYEPYGEYREFDLDKDVFPGIPLNIMPVYILETEQWTFVWAFDVDREYVYEWDKVSEVYNSVKWRDRK